MKNKKIRVAVLYGGKSAEHEISIMSAKNIIKALDKNKYSIASIKIGKKGVVPTDRLKTFDVVFPVLHGPYGEDGSMQGFFKILGVPYVGSGVLTSALAMDKDITKRLLTQAGIKNAKSVVLRTGDKVSFQTVKKALGVPMFVKPANMGSSVGVSKVGNKKEFDKAIKDAFKYDSKILIEEAVVGRELECAVLGNDEPVASGVGEVVIQNAKFYSYDAKYINEDGALIEIPAQNISAFDLKKLREIAVEAYRALECAGMARVDMFLTKRRSIYVNEINTIPGFTNISMYPKLWTEAGIGQNKLMDILINLAIERFTKEKKLKKDRN